MQPKILLIEGEGGDFRSKKASNVVAVMGISVLCPQSSSRTRSDVTIPLKDNMESITSIATTLSINGGDPFSLFLDFWHLRMKLILQILIF
ncbi:hypothetical protein TNIN_87641 [Trichonephila inaurata madagascariensis]|uniref:Uncharacterized protein n=1 Tax=Trichonephila inaurata madagascariensis TaxID=2747483 RepID=A0A8X7CLI8_9ARAC|nr:hypothetical protein TNIN_87641 [Trichonephila inaurata madagascariensis]